MPFRVAAVYDLERGEFVAYTIYKDGPLKLASTNLWTDNETSDLQAQLDRLNDDVSVKMFWPQVQDPDVQTLLNDESFMPIEKYEEEVVDDEHSIYFYLEEPDPETGDPGIVDKQNSILVYKNVMVPKEPTAVIQRIKKACEIVARRRADNDMAGNSYG